MLVPSCGGILTLFRQQYDQVWHCNPWRKIATRFKPCVNTMLLHIDKSYRSSILDSRLWQTKHILSILLNHLETLDFPTTGPPGGFSGRTKYHRDASNNVSRSLCYPGCYSDIAVSSKTKSKNIIRDAHTHTHAHVPQLTCHTSSHLHQIGCLSVEVEKTETQTNKNFNGISNLTLFNKLLIWSNRSQYFTNQQAKPNGKSMKKSSPNVGETPWGNHCLKGSVCLDLSVWPRSFQDHPSPIPKEFVQNNPGETSEVEQAKSNLTSTEQRMRHSNFSTLNITKRQQ